ncbi:MULTISPECIES: hypothetical protein [unclassified Mesorhizobium]|uniref:hypothetical protein n=1 Tax=unclassified Mesorhizobium TaxID=325217 RepID=UPI00167A0EB0|nr:MULTISPECIES: hypothetical protein [unclassified Mesorhizobium]
MERPSPVNVKACLPIGRWREESGLLRSHLLVVVMMMVVMHAMMLVVMTVMVVLRHRRSISTGRAEDRHRERQGQSQPKGGEEGLLHNLVSFVCGPSEIHRTKSVTQASRSGLSSWIFSTIFPNCRFLFLDCFWLADRLLEHPLASHRAKQGRGFRHDSRASELQLLLGMR